jgi:hypothetical protein
MVEPSWPAVEKIPSAALHCDPDAIGTSFLIISRALHLDLFKQPEKKTFSTT